MNHSQKQNGMTELQLSRWLQLSTGLAKSSYPTITNMRRSKLLEAITDCIDYIVCNGLETVSDWDSSTYINGHLAEYSVGTRMSDYLWDKGHKFERERKRDVELITTRFGLMLSSCVRAGFDVAVSPSAGVIGFSVGDLRGAFGGELPYWVKEFFDEGILENAAASDGVWL